MEVYVGEVLERAVRRQEISISELSRRLNVSRRTIYNWFEQRSLDIGLLYTIGLIIRYDFAEELGADFKVGNNQVPNPYEDDSLIPDNFNSLSNKESYYWMQKYIQLLEDYKQLLERVRT